MKQGKYAAPVRRRRRRNTLKPMLIAMAVVLLLGCVTGGTLAWLTSTTGEVINTFTVGDINIDLTETWNYDSDGNGTIDSWQGKMIPGHTITKDPKVTVKANSEKCYLFVKLTKSNNFDSFMPFGMATGWAEVPGQNGVYYRIVERSGSDQYFYVLENNQVSVRGTVTKSDMNALTSSTYPTLTVQASAVQYFETNGEAFDVAGAYALAFSTTTP